MIQKRYILMVAATIGLCFGSGCTDENNDNNEGEAALTSDQLLARIDSLFIDYQCGRAFQCPERQGSLLFTFGRFKDEAQCKATLTAEFELKPQLIRPSLAAGRLRYNPSVSRACITAFEAFVKDDLCQYINHDDDDDNGKSSTGFEPPAACNELWTGLVEAGSNCLYTTECAAGLECDYKGDSCSGVCTTTQPCSSCTDAQYCDEENGQLTCKTRSAIGSDCTRNICAQGATCLRVGDQVGKCIADRSVDSGGACNDDIQCKVDRCGEDGLCDAMPSTPTIGEVAEECDIISSFCKPSLTCQSFDPVTKRGQCKPALALGGACDFTRECEYGLFCQGADPGMTKGTCAEPLADGQTCMYHEECLNRFCDYDTKKCGSETLCAL